MVVTNPVDRLGVGIPLLLLLVFDHEYLCWLGGFFCEISIKHAEKVNISSTGLTIDLSGKYTITMSWSVAMM